MSKTIGRNDRCYCGSGRKYKHCHLVLDEKRTPFPRHATEDWESTSAPLHPGQIARLLRDIPRQGSKKERAKFDRLVAQTQPILDYLERRDEIDAASTALEAHREEFNRLRLDEKAYLARVQALFAEDCFAALRFTANDIRRAFDKVGYPPNLSLDDDAVKLLRAAVLFLADNECRSRLAMSLLSHLPNFVKDGRYLDAYLIQVLAHLTGDDGEETNPFLFEMFSRGYDAWIAEQNARNEAFLRESGMDPARLRGMGIEEIDAWLQAQQASPEQKARLEKLLDAHPDQRAIAVASIQKFERNFIQLLEREDARELLLTQAEIEPCLPAVIEHFESARKVTPDLFGEAPPDKAGTDAAADVIWPALGEMAQAIFNPERIQQLASQFRKYREQKFAAGDMDAAGCALSVINSLEREDDPSRNYFLNVLCFASLHALLGAMANSNPQNQDVAPPDEPSS